MVEQQQQQQQHIIGYDFKSKEKFKIQRNSL